MSKIVKNTIQEKIKTAELYKDPHNIDNIISKILNTEKHNDIRNIIEETFPSWILGSTDSYCLDYPHLQKNWDHVCDKINTKKTQIVIVDYINSDEDHKLIPIFCELMTRFGYCVRRKEEYIGCCNCGKAIPMIEIWKQMKLNGIKTPENWSKKCSNC